MKYTFEEKKPGEISSIGKPIIYGYVEKFYDKQGKVWKQSLVPYRDVPYLLHIPFENEEEVYNRVFALSTDGRVYELVHKEVVDEW